MGSEGAGASRAAGDGFRSEDKFLVNKGLGLYIVCDGMSETPAGEVAARIAAEALESYIAAVKRDHDLTSGSMARDLVERAMSRALAALTEAERSDPDLEGLSTTVTLLLVHGTLGVIGHRGDSRAYFLRGSYAQQLTVDHELTGAAKSDVDDFDVFSLSFKIDDTIVLCTDGAEAVMDDDAFVQKVGDLPPRLLARKIVAEAHRLNPQVDATAVAVRFKGDHRFGWMELSRPVDEMDFSRMLQVA